MGFVLSGIIRMDPCPHPNFNVLYTVSRTQFLVTSWHFRCYDNNLWLFSECVIVLYGANRFSCKVFQGSFPLFQFLLVKSIKCLCDMWLWCCWCDATGGCKCRFCLLIAQDTFVRAKSWVKELQRQASPNIVIALAGNKSDLADKRLVETEVLAQCDSLFADCVLNIVDLWSQMSVSNWACATSFEKFP